jgi:hypothetical protein
MSLLTEASLIVTPNAFKAGKLYSVIPNTTLGDLGVTRATTATRVNEFGLIEVVGLNVPRLDYTSGTPSILVEPQRTNLVTFSNTFSNASWTKLTTTVTDNTTTSPDGTVNGSRINFTGGAAALTKGSVNIGTNVTVSVYLKGTAGQTISLSAGGNNLVVTLSGVFQRFVLNNPNTTSTFVNINTSNGATARVVEAYGFQAELGSFATSYIPTVAASVTRNSDLISKTGISGLVNSQEGVLFLEIAALTSLPDGNKIISISDGNPNNRVQILFTSSNNGTFCNLIVAGVQQASFGTFSPVTTNFTKIAFSYKLNQFKLFVNGSQFETTNTSGNVFSANTLNSLTFGLANSGNINNAFEGKVKQLQIYKTALTDAKLTALTTP